MKRLLIKIRDRITYSRLTNFMRLWLAIVVRLFKQRESVRLDLLMRAYRLAESKGLRKWLDGKIAPYLSGPRQSIWREDRIGWSRYSGWLANPRLTRTLILKAPRADGEKGALLVVTDYNWLRLFVNIPDLRALEEEYFLILSTSWSPADYAIIATGLTCWRGPLFIQACNYKEIPKLNEFHPRVHCLPTIACDWINPDLFQPKPHAQRQTDILMVANWEPFKRHWQLFDALRQLPRDLRITLIGQGTERHTLAMVRDQAALFGVKQDINFLESIPVDEVTRHQCDSKISLILSRREGCCVAAVESLFADSPLGMMRKAHVGPTAYINAQTGTLLDSGRMGYQLRRFLETAESYQPRRWAIENISCHRSHEKLNALLRDYSHSNGLPWSVDLKVPCWRPYPLYVNPSDREEMSCVYADLHRRYPEVFRPGLPEAGNG